MNITIHLALFTVLLPSDAPAAQEATNLQLSQSEAATRQLSSELELERQRSTQYKFDNAILVSEGNYALQRAAAALEGERQQGGCVQEALVQLERDNAALVADSARLSVELVRLKTEELRELRESREEMAELEATAQKVAKALKVGSWLHLVLCIPKINPRKIPVIHALSGHWVRRALVRATQLWALASAADSLLKCICILDICHHRNSPRRIRRPLQLPRHSPWFQSPPWTRRRPLRNQKQAG